VKGRDDVTPTLEEMSAKPGRMATGFIMRCDGQSYSRLRMSAGERKVERVAKRWMHGEEGGMRLGAPFPIR